MSEAMRFMVEVEGHFPREAICVRLLNHLQKHCESICRAPHFNATRNVIMSSEHIVPTPNSHDTIRTKGKLNSNNESVISKTEPEPNNNDSNAFDMRNHNQMMVSENDYDKAHVENNNHMSYKYKTNIKLRFTQDINGGCPESVKRQKLENGRRNSVTSTENQRYTFLLFFISDKLVACYDVTSTS